ncbi:MAG TPA: OmpA family protein [Polyangia bacterium]|nr:OmpA family protein [Polyangia bacterium]
MARNGRPVRTVEQADLLAYSQEEDTSWLIPYVDVISLLLSFLILALAMSKVDLHKFEKVSAAISKHTPPPSLDVLKEKIDGVIASQGLSDQVKTVVDDNGLKMELKNALLFESGQADITPTGRSAINRVAKLLPSIDSRYQIAIEGHTDDVPIHTGRFDSNWELSSARAINVLKLFTAAGIDPQHLSAQGYADTRPATPIQGDAAAQTRARAENRRVVIRVH